MQVLFRQGGLLPAGEDQLLPLLAGLLAQFAALPLRFLPHGGGGDQPLPFPSGLGQDLLGLQAGLLDKAVPLTQQILSLGDLHG